MTDDDRMRKRCVRFDDRHSSNSDDSDTDIRDEFRLKYKKMKSERKVAQTRKQTEQCGKEERTNNELVCTPDQTSTITSTMKIQI